MVNDSMKRDPRFWTKWRRSGAVPGIKGGFDRHWEYLPRTNRLDPGSMISLILHGIGPETPLRLVNADTLQIYKDYCISRPSQKAVEDHRRWTLGWVYERAGKDLPVLQALLYQRPDYNEICSQIPPWLSVCLYEIYWLDCIIEREEEEEEEEE